MLSAPGTAGTALVCTGNQHKVEELRTLLPEWTLLPLPAGTELPPETGETLVDNARIKAHGGKHLAPQGAWVIADDSGLCVDALDGAPGVKSARFAGEDAQDADNTALLLTSLASVDAPRRGAHFACVLVAISPSGDEVIASGKVMGTIAAAPRGTGGFGYDPVFIPEGFDQTFAELGQDIKDSMSHRSRAAAALAMQLPVYSSAAAADTSVLP